MIKTAHQLITDMCYTTRHDYGLLKDDNDTSFSSGMTRSEQEFLYSQMEQLYNNCFKSIHDQVGLVNYVDDNLPKYDMLLRVECDRGNEYNAYLNDDDDFCIINGDDVTGKFDTDFNLGISVIKWRYI